MSATSLQVRVPVSCDSESNRWKINKIYFLQNMVSCQLPWTAYSLDWSENDDSFCKIAISSFVPSKQNHLNIYSLPASDSSFKHGDTEELKFEFVGTKVRWIPKGEYKGSEYLAVSGMGVNVWRRDGHSLYTPVTKLIQSPGNLRRGSVPAGTTGPVQNKNPPAPVTSFDWNRVDSNLIVTASYDTTCTVWDLETNSIRTQLIAHDKEVFDVSFSAATPDIFVSVGGDGSLRMFDTR